MDSNRADAVCVVPEEENHVISKRYIQRIGRHNLNLRLPLFRPGRCGCHQGQRKRMAKALTIIQVIPLPIN
ncbi:IS1 family transposase [Citrobacter amalonaticus]|uniref:IS1 family transposase n=1 Tax=Citrobacter amalonaticus TaxID=35703 RepID=UPI00374C8E99